MTTVWKRFLFQKFCYNLKELLCDSIKQYSEFF